MKNTFKKAAVTLVGIFAIALVFGNTLLAQNWDSGGLVTASDLAFIKGESNSTVTQAAPVAVTSGDLISGADLAFVSQPFAKVAGNGNTVGSEASVGLVSLADYRFITGTSVEADCDEFSTALAANCVVK